MEVQGKIEKKLSRIDNTSNKNLERITRLEQSNVKLCEDMKLLRKEKITECKTQSSGESSLGDQTIGEQKW